jgi:hypothetical protein
MAKRGKKVVKEYYEPKYKEKFKQFMKPPGKNETKTLAGFKLKNVNQLWRWDNLNDV